jgi:hypothetical protein
MTGKGFEEVNHDPGKKDPGFAEKNFRCENIFSLAVVFSGETSSPK